MAQQFSSKAQTLTWWSLWQLLISLVIPTGCSQLALALWEIQQSHFLPSWFLAKPRAAYGNLFPQCSRRDSSKRFHSELSEAGGNHVSVTLRLSRGYYTSWGLLVGHGGYLYAIALSEVKKYSAPHGVTLDWQWLATRLARTVDIMSNNSIAWMSPLIEHWGVQYIVGVYKNDCESKETYFCTCKERKDTSTLLSQWRQQAFMISVQAKSHIHAL